jgi:hypothetical protein
MLHQASSDTLQMGKLIGAESPLRPNQVWSIRTRLLIGTWTRDLVLFNLAIDSKLHRCDVVALMVEDVAPNPNGYMLDRSTAGRRRPGSRSVRVDRSRPASH